MFRPQFLAIFREIVSFATCAIYESNCLLKDFNILIISLVIYVKLVLNKLTFKLHFSKNLQAP